MHPNPAYRKTSRENNIEFARKRSFGVLAVNGDNGPLVSHIPFQLSQDGKLLEAHLVRSNPIVHELETSVPAIIAVYGGDTYISPDWYGLENQVPTWNYVVVHLRGELRLLAQQQLHGILERLSANMESRLTDKVPWTVDKMDRELYGRLQRQIVPVAMSIKDVQGTWKLAQNKPTQARLGAAQGAATARIGFEIDWIAELMTAVRED